MTMGGVIGVGVGPSLSDEARYREDLFSSSKSFQSLIIFCTLEIILAVL